MCSLRMYGQCRSVTTSSIFSFVCISSAASLYCSNTFRDFQSIFFCIRFFLHSNRNQYEQKYSPFLGPFFAVPKKQRHETLGIDRCHRTEQKLSSRENRDCISLGGELTYGN